MQDISLTLTDALHLVALAPCLFAVILLFALNGFSKRVLVPVLFFFTLSSAFLIGLDEALYSGQKTILLSFYWIESIHPAIAFLLIVQLWRDRFPPAIYWLILALPVIGGTSLVVSSLQLKDACIFQEYCLEAYELRMLYQFFAMALIFLLLTVHLSRFQVAHNQQSRYQSHRYWLIIALIISYLSLMVTDLVALTGQISFAKHETIHVIMRLCFIYLVMTSLFRVFDAKQDKNDDATGVSKQVPQEVVERIKREVEVNKLHREMNFSREQCAQRLEIPEHVLSRAINQQFGKNFNEFINSYRVEEAKHRLASENTSVTAIAFEVGFSSIASFNRVFKSMVGQSPTEYRSANNATGPQDQS